MTKRLSKKDIKTLKRDGVYDTVKNLDVKVCPASGLAKALALLTVGIHGWKNPSAKMGDNYVRLGLGFTTIRLAFNADVIEDRTPESNGLAALAALPKEKRKTKRS